MAKKILIFSDGTGQIGGLRPDQRLSNIYKMYRAMRSGPDSTISPQKQVAYYDPGVGTGETGGLSYKRIKNIISSAIGTGINENMIDCYEAIIANYEEGDEVLLFGFSRGAYTVRCVANVMNLCGIPTKMPDGKPVPRFGPELRKIAFDAVNFVYEHGSGKNRREYEDEREEKALRFRTKYGSNGFGMDGETQGNVQPKFIGVFDTVAALGTTGGRRVIFKIGIALIVATYFSFANSWPWVLQYLVLSLAFLFSLWWLRVIWKQIKYFTPDGGGKSTWHFASWDLKHYDRFLDNMVGHARHALSIDENRKSFPNVGWGSAEDIKKTKDRKPAWLKQLWFVGNHSDIGGSYPEAESRLSDIALKWMIDELKEAMPDIKIHGLNVYPAANGMQHDEIIATRHKIARIPGFKYLPVWIREKLTWSSTHRKIPKNAPLHSTVIQRIKLPSVSHLGSLKPYRPKNLNGHSSKVDKILSGNSGPSDQ